MKTITRTAYRPLVSLAGVVAAAMLLTSCAGGSSSSTQDESGPLKLGVLYSLSGGLSITEKPMHDATMLAVKEINAAGGINGRQIEPIVEDYASNFKTVADKATKLTTQDEVIATVGQYTSASRKASLPVFEKNKGLLIYPTQYEGLECSPNILYTGVVPNQQLTDFIPWVSENLGKKFYLVGSDYIYPKTTNAIVRKLIEQSGGEVVGEEYAPLDHTEFGGTVSKIKNSGANVIFSVVVGASIPAFYKQYNAAGMDPNKVPIVSPVTSELEIAAMGAEVAAGSYSTSPYFETVETEANSKFVQAIKQEYGEKTVTNREMEAAYNSVYLFKAAAEKAPDLSVEALTKAFSEVSFLAPQGEISGSPNHHTSARALVGKANGSGQFDIIGDFGSIDPDPFPAQVIDAGKAPTCPVAGG